MYTNIKKFTAVLLAVIMMISMIPVNVFAEIYEAGA